MTNMYEIRNQYPRRSPISEKRGDDDLLVTTRDVCSTPCETSSTDDSSSSDSCAFETDMSQNRYMKHHSQDRKTVGKTKLSINTKDNDEHAVYSTRDNVSPLKFPGEDSISKYIERTTSPTNGFMRIKTLRSTTSVNSVTSIVSLKSRMLIETEFTRKHKNTHRYASLNNKKAPEIRHEYFKKTTERNSQDNYFTTMSSIEETNPINAVNNQKTSLVLPLPPPPPPPPMPSHNPDTVNGKSKNRISKDKQSSTARMIANREKRSRKNSSKLTVIRESEKNNQSNFKRLNENVQSPRVRMNRRDQSLRNQNAVQSTQTMNPPSDFWSEYLPGIMCCTATSVIGPHDGPSPTHIIDKLDLDTSDDAIVLQAIKKMCSHNVDMKHKNLLRNHSQSMLNLNDIVIDLVESERIRFRNMKAKDDFPDKQDISSDKKVHSNHGAGKEFSREFNDWSLDSNMFNNEPVDGTECMSSYVDVCFPSENPQKQNEKYSDMQHQADNYEDKSINTKIASLQSIIGPALGTFNNKIESTDDIISILKSPSVSEFVGTYGKYRMDDRFIDEIMKDMICSVPLYHTVLNMRGVNENASSNEGNRDLSNLSMCSETLASSFSVRGPTYISDEKKVLSEESMFALLGIDFFRCKGKNVDNKHMCVKQNSFYNRLRKLCDQKGYSVPFLFVVNFVTPFGNLIAYFYRPDSNGQPLNIKLQNKPAEKLWQQFLDGDENYRNKRLKFIPNIHAGPWMVKKLVGSKPALIGQKIPTTYYGSSEDNYMEVCFDVTKGGSVANSICSTCAGKSDIITVDLCFLVEGLDTQELPEQILASLRLHHIKVKKCPTMDEWDEVLMQRCLN